MLTDNMTKIQVALESGATVRNEKGERIKLPDGSENGPKRTGDCVKCYINGTHWYWSAAEKQGAISVNGEPFDAWLEQQPLPIE